jgi:hypothetical protein
MAESLNLVGYLVSYDNVSKSLLFKYCDFKKETVSGISGYKGGVAESETKEKLERMDTTISASQLGSDTDVHYSSPLLASGFKIKIGSIPLAVVNKYMLNDVSIKARIYKFSFINFNNAAGVQSNKRVIGWNLTLTNIEFHR